MHTVLFCMTKLFAHSCMSGLSNPIAHRSVNYVVQCPTLMSTTIFGNRFGGFLVVG